MYFYFIVNFTKIQNSFLNSKKYIYKKSSLSFKKLAKLKLVILFSLIFIILEHDTSKAKQKI